MRTLSTRLVVTAVLLVAIVCAIIAVSMTVGMRSYLTNQLDDRIQEAGRSIADPGPRGPGPFGGRPRDEFGNQAPGTLIVINGAGRIAGYGFADSTLLSETDVQEASGDPSTPVERTVDLGEGRYRVNTIADDDGAFTVGLPTEQMDDYIAALIRWEIALTLLGVVVAAGAGIVVVRRQLAPLRDVAATAHSVSELPLATGEIDLSERVPDHLTDERTEVGQVGAALNTLLSHVESSLEARHRSEQQVRQFVADASHELRTPLSTIQGYAELARRHPAQTEVALTKVESESIRMTALVEDLLLLARLDSGRPLASAPVDLTRLLVEAVSDARVLAPDHHWRLDLPAEAVEVTGDEQRLHQVVTNLLTNARKHTPAGTTVTVSARPGSLVVHDDGPGFAPGLVDEAFERFARADAARTRGPDRGAGLGLALVKAIVEAHGGSVALMSRPGDTTVTIDLA